MATDRVQTGLRLSEPLYMKVRVLAAREKRSLNNLIEYVIGQYVEDYEREYGTIAIQTEEFDI